MNPPSLNFLEELRERARRYGWSGDYTEIEEFVKVLYKEAGITLPEEAYTVIESE